MKLLIVLLYSHQRALSLSMHTTHYTTCSSSSQYSPLKLAPKANKVHLEVRAVAINLLDGGGYDDNDDYARPTVATTGMGTLALE